MNVPNMRDKAMERFLAKGEALDVLQIGKPVEGEPGKYELNEGAFNKDADVDYLDSEKERWIWSIGRRKSDGKIIASLAADLYENPEFECLWLR